MADYYHTGGTVYAIYPEYAYVIPPSPERVYIREQRRQEQYEESVIEWDKAYHLAEDVAIPAGETSSVAAAVLESPDSIATAEADALNPESSFERYA